MVSYSNVFVRYQDGTKATGVQVVLGFPGAFGGKTKPVLTDGQGVAVVQHHGGGQATVYVDGKKITTFKAPGEADVIL